MKVAFLLVELAGYFSRCVEELAALPDTSVLVIRGLPVGQAPYALEEVTPNGVTVRTYPKLPSGREVSAELNTFRPDIVMAAGWQVRPFRYALRTLPSGTVRVVFMDNQWLGTPKQIAGIVVAPWYVHSVFDVAFIPGRNQEIFARKLGFKNRQIWRGCNTCDHSRFANIHRERDSASFLYVGRFVHQKGISTLLEAYKTYRSRAAEPWKLVMAGAGPLRSLLVRADGLEVVDFVQPAHLPDVYAAAACLVLPSLFEPWGIVVHEAAASNLPVIVSDACGCVPHLVEDGVSGFIVQAGDVEELASRMLDVSAMAEADRRMMGAAGYELSLRYTPQRWARLFRQRSEAALATRNIRV